MIIVGFSLASPLAAQGISSGRIRGVVHDTAGVPMGNVRLAVTDRRSGFTHEARTPRRGSFTFAFLPPGVYDVLAERLGWLPVEIRGVRVVGDGDVELDIRLEPVEPPVLERSVSILEARRLDRTQGSPQWDLGRLELRDLTDEGRNLGSASRFSSIAGSDLAIEGLPASMTQVSVDGIPFRFPRHPLIGQEEPDLMALPVLAFDRATIDAGGVDVEWTDFAAGRLQGQGIRGSNQFETTLYADWAPTSFASSKYYDYAGPGGNSVRGGMMVSGPVIRDTAHFVLGFDAQRIQAVLPPAWQALPGDSALYTVGDSLGVDLRPFGQPVLTTVRKASGVARFDWQANQTNRLTFLSLGSLVDADNPSLGRRAAALGGARKGYDLAAGVDLTSVLSTTVALEFRAGFETGRREYSGNDTAMTVMADGPASWGTAPAIPGTFRHTGFRVGEGIHFTFGQQRLKFGGSASFDSQRDDYAYDRRGTFVFGGPGDLELLDGGFHQTVGPEPIAKFSSYQFGIFLQDRWQFAPGAELVFGGRVDWEHVGRDALIRNQQLFTGAGIATDLIDATHTKFSPRLGFIWDVANKHRWVVHLEGGLYQGTIAREAFGEAVAQNGAGETREAVTTALGRWPDVPDSTAAPPQGSVVSVLPFSFSAPRTSRAMLGLTGSLGGGTNLHLSGTVRRTDFLVRRRDLNRVPGVVAYDQYNRPVYGELEQHGTAVLATPGSNRRLQDFSSVNALDQDGVSDYLGMTAWLERRAGGAVKLSIGYTYSKTTDNVPGLARGPDAQLSPFPDSLNGVEWDEGVSDFDVPHRMVLGAELNLRVARLSGFFRYESGLPFTPGFRDGVDANGDGSWRNDPAFIDNAVEGVADLLPTWDCLRTQLDVFADRNSCRGPARKSLDLRLALGPFRLGYPVEIVLDAINVLNAENADVDRALYLVDRAGTLTRDPAAGTVRVPLVVNPDFGRAIRRYGFGRYLRIGLRVNYD